MSPQTWVFWVHASNAARFEQSFQDIANTVNLAGRKSPEADIFQLVHDWLRDNRKGGWVLILDNVDDASFLVETRGTCSDGQSNNKGSGSSRPLVTYLPQCLNGSIVITTRSNSAALKLVEKRDIIPVGPMGTADALALLDRKLGWHDEGNDAAELVAALEFMPLAIVQAAAYITQRIPRYSVREYLQDFRKSDPKRVSLLRYEGGQLRRDWEANNSILITWQISFNCIQKIRPSAAELLSLMSFFDPQGIPETLLRSRSEQRISWKDQKEGNNITLADDDTDYVIDHEDDNSQASVNDGFEDDILTLRHYSFISANKDDITFEMHRLVQLATREWLQVHGQQERWQQLFIKNLDAEFPTGEYENWVKCQTLLPHAQSAATHRPEEQDVLIVWASILHKAAWYMLKIGNWLDAEKMSIQAMKVAQNILGNEHNDTMNIMERLSIAYEHRGRWDAAEQLQVQVVETRKKKLGVNHPNTLIGISNLVSIYMYQGRWDAAEELGVQVTEACKKKLGVDHPDTLTNISNLASIYMYQGRQDAAEELGVQVTEASKKKLGVDHPDTLISMNNLALIYRYQGRWDAAEELQVQVTEAHKKKLGVDHPNTLTSISNLASIYRHQGRWDTAEELQVQVMEACKKKLRVDHPDTLASMSNLALIYMYQGRWDAAEELQVQVLEARKKKLGVNHPNTLASLNNLAHTWKQAGREAEAIRLMEECIQSQKIALGPNHPDAILSCEALASWKPENLRLSLQE